MNGEQRRIWILNQLQTAKTPLSATRLAQMTGVSRQIVVGDVALLRAGGEQIEATPRGYRMIPQTEAVTFLVACRHSQMQQIRQELYLIVDNGGTVQDVIVENPIYGQITAKLHIGNRCEADLFLQKATKENQSLLSNLTDGVHLHTVQCKDKRSAEHIKTELQKAGILYQ